MCFTSTIRQFPPRLQKASGPNSLRRQRESSAPRGGGPGSSRPQTGRVPEPKPCVRGPSRPLASRCGTFVPWALCTGRPGWLSLPSAPLWRTRCWSPVSWLDRGAVLPELFIFSPSNASSSRPPRAPSPSRLPEGGSPWREGLLWEGFNRVGLSAHRPPACRHMASSTEREAGDLAAPCVGGEGGSPRAPAGCPGAMSPTGGLCSEPRRLRSVPALGTAPPPSCGGRGLRTLSSGPTARLVQGAWFPGGGMPYKHPPLPQVFAGEQTEAQRLSLSVPRPHGCFSQGGALNSGGSDSRTHVPSRGPFYPTCSPPLARSEVTPGLGQR